MRNLIEQLLIEYNVDEKQLSIGETVFDWSIFAWSKNEKIDDYYLFVGINAKDFIKLLSSYSNIDAKKLETLHSHWIYDLKKIVSKQFIQKNSLTTRDWEKSISLVIVLNCSEEDPRTADESNKLLFDFEENPYSFKKTILFYTGKELDALEKERGKEEIYKYLNSIILDETYFEYFKKSANNNRKYIYSLVSQLFIKISFLVLPDKKDSEVLQDLGRKISFELERNNLVKLTKRLIELKNIDSISEDDLLALINK